MIHGRLAERAGGGAGGHRAAIAWSGLILLALGGSSASGQCEQDKLLAADGAAEDWFGVSVAIEGDRALVGAPQDDHPASNCGSARAYRFDGSAWVQDATDLLAADGDASDFFGFALAIDGEYAIVGAWGDDERGVNAGAAYVFHDTATAWVQQAKLMASDGQTADEFGRAVAVCGDLVLIGAPGDDDNGPNTGAAYVFRRSGSIWIQEAKLIEMDVQPGDGLGTAVAIGDDIALLGAPHDRHLGADAGAVLVFMRNGTSWTPMVTLYASDGNGGDQFGFSVALDGDRTLVGARWDDENAYRAGSAYVLHRDGLIWTEQAKLLPADGETLEEFGYSLAVDGDAALVGARWDDDNGYHAGSAYVFTADGLSWSEHAKLIAPDGAEYDRFGLAVSLSGETAIIGAWGDDDLGENSGSAYAFDLLGEDCNENGICDWRDIANGTSPDVNGNGIPDECEPCPADVNGDGEVNVVDLLILLASWGPCPPVGDCLGDIDENGVVDVIDLLALLADWGPCLS